MACRLRPRQRRCAKSVDLTSHVAGILYKYVIAADSMGHWCPTRGRSLETAEALEAAEKVGDDFSLGIRPTRSRDGARSTQRASHRADGSGAGCNKYRDACVRHGYATDAVRLVDIEIAKEKARAGGLDGAIELGATGVECRLRIR